MSNAIVAGYVVTSGGLSNDALVQTGNVDDALDDAGYLLMLGTALDSESIPRWKKATQGTIPTGISFASTKSPITQVAAANVLVGVMPLRDGVEYYVKLSETNATIVFGDPLCLSATAGLVDKRDGTTNNEPIVGYALGAATASTGGVLKMRCSTRMMGKFETSTTIVNTKNTATSASAATMEGLILWDPAKWNLAKIKKIEIEAEIDAATDTTAYSVGLYDVTNSDTIATAISGTAALSHTVVRADVTA